MEILVLINDVPKNRHVHNVGSKTSNAMFPSQIPVIKLCNVEALFMNQIKYSQVISPKNG